MAVLDITDKNLDETLNNNKIVILDFWAPWCGPCKQFAPTFEEMSEKFSDITFAKVNTEEEQSLGAQFQIRSIPTLMIFKEKIAIFSQAGALAPADLETVLKKALEVDMDKVREEIKKSEADKK